MYDAKLFYNFYRKKAAWKMLYADLEKTRELAILGYKFRVKKVSSFCLQQWVRVYREDKMQRLEKELEMEKQKNKNPEILLHNS